MSRSGQIISRFPDFYRSGDSENLFYQYIKVFASMLDDTEEELLRVMKTHWVNTADNEGSKGFDAAEKGDLDKILALYLESLGGTALLKQGKRRNGAEGKADDALYRTRILGLIQVLKNGASTRAGIIDIVAANLGIVPDLPYAAQAHDGIKIIEFLPDAVDIGAPVPVSLFENVPINNLSPLPVVPELRLTFQNDLPLPLVDPKMTNPATGEFVQYIGTVTPGDTLDFLSDGTGLFRGQSFQPAGGLKLPAGLSNIHLEAKVGVPKGTFDTAFFNYSQFDTSTLREIGVFDAVQFDKSIFTYSNPVATLEVRYARLSPGSFMVAIPWDVPGFSVNISIKQHTLDRLLEFGVSQSLLDEIAASPLFGKEVETLEIFFTELGALVGNRTPIVLSRQIVGQLKLFGMPASLINKVGALVPPDQEKVGYNNVQDLFDALGAVNDAERKALYSALGILAKPGSLPDLILRECLFTDKFARFDISPRGQIKAIVDRVKAAGVYAVIAFEKRFWENQNLEDQLGLVLAETAYDQGMFESNFDLLSNQSSSEQQELHDLFHAGGVFDYTRFDALNTFS